MVFFRSKISPFTATMIFLDRSPFAIEAAARSFQMPATPFTLDWPPSLPSVPTSRATRVTSGGERIEPIHHRVDDFADVQEIAAELPAVDRDTHLLKQIASCNGFDHARHFRRGAKAGRVPGRSPRLSRPQRDCDVAKTMRPSVR